MYRTFVCDLPEHIGQTVTVCGWVNARRLQRAMQFVIVGDSTGLVQITHKRAGDQLETDIESLTGQSAVAVTGRVASNPVVKLGGLEIVPERVDVLGPAQAPLPIDEHSAGERRLDWRYLDIRLRPAARLVLDVASTFEHALREFARGEGFTEMHTPKLMGTASESGAEVFHVRYFGGAAFLAQSPQFYKQMAIAAGIERVLEIGPVFRAEPSFTSRHTTEFASIDAEMAWIDSPEDVMALEERMLAHALTAVASAHGAAIERAFGTEVRVPRLPFPRITMEEALEVMRNGGWDPAREAEDLDPQAERGISAHIARETGHEFVFVTGYPASVRPFYHMRPADRPDLTLSFDLLWNGLEITTGAQREHRYEVLLSQAAEKGMSTGPMQWYLDCFRYGCPPHGGLGLGLSRVLMAMLGLDSIRDAVFLFRGPNRLTP